MNDLKYYVVADDGDVPPGEGRAYAVAGRMIAVFNDSGQLFAIDDLCPHMGASLAAGYLEDRTVSCPWHAWRFRVDDGTWCDNPKISVDHFAVRVVRGKIEVGVVEDELADRRPLVDRSGGSGDGGCPPPDDQSPS